MLLRVDPVAAEVKQRQRARLARPVAVALVEAGDLIARIAAGRRQEADLRQRLLGQCQHEAIERGAALVHREAPAAHREYATCVAAHAAIGSPLITAGSPRKRIGSSRSVTTPSPSADTCSALAPRLEQTASA